MNPKYENAHYNLADLLQYEFDDKKGAKESYETTIEINPENAEAHGNLAILLKDKFNDFQGAKKYYLIAITLKPSFRSEKYDKYFGISN